MKKILLLFLISSLFTWTAYANKSVYSEDFETTIEDNLSEHWLEKSAYGTTSEEWNDRIITDGDSKVYRLAWGKEHPQLLKWKGVISSYEFSADVKGGGSNPEFNGLRAHPASLYIRTTHTNLGVPEYEMDGVENVVGYAGIVITFRDSWISVEIKNGSNTYKDANSHEDGNWFYFKGVGNNSNTNFTNINVVDDGTNVIIKWNNEVLVQIEMSEAKVVEYGEKSAEFYTKAVVKNAAGEVLRTVNDARIATGEEATLAFAVRAQTLYVDNITLTQDTNDEPTTEPEPTTENPKTYDSFTLIYTVPALMSLILVKRKKEK